MSAQIRTTVVGSYPVPEWLRVLPTIGNRRDAVLAVTKTQELAGIDVISDGELSRFDVNHPETNGMIDYFVRPMGGVASRLSRKELEAFHKKAGFEFRARPAGAVRGSLDEGELDLAADFAAVRALTERSLKFTVTSPYMLAKTLLDVHYGSLHALVLAIADVLARQIEAIDADVVQVDEANLPGSPQDATMAAEGINRVLAAANGEKGVHLCFGNYGGQTIQKGFFRDLLPFFNALECDHLVLEFARRGYDELDVFRDLKPSIALGVGVIDIKDNEVESPDEVARRIEHAAGLLSPERLKWVHPDCGFWMLHRSVADRKMQSLVQGRDRALGLPRGGSVSARS
ncbi:MAG: cobalamin-independent methionine synthase II family protein [Planctomycetes bacterium]|nr:cobalamin-independent methionine synthase II family protein [Planctomycetota bacterium]